MSASAFNRRSLFGSAIAWASASIIDPNVRAVTPVPQASAPWPAPDWPVQDPQRLGIDRVLPAAVLGAARAAPSVTGIVVIRHGAIAAEYYASGWSRNDTLDIRSCTKSIVGALVGAARQQAMLPHLEITIGDLIPNRIPASADPRVATIPLWSLLTMTSGIAWDWSTDYQRLEAAEDPVAYVLSQPIADEPGAFYAYNSGGSHLIGLMVAAATGQPLEGYAASALFEPLGMQPGGWRRTPQGEVIGGYGLQLTPRDMARLGYLYLHGGVWNDDQLIAPDYISQSTTWQSSGDPTGGTPYGYQWWVTSATGYDAFYALGYGGQYIYVVPALDLIVVTSVGNVDVPLYPPRPIIESTVIPLVYPE